MTAELKKEILDILDNVYYWETCPKDYKVRIKAIKEQLTLTDVVASLKHKQAIAFEEYTKSEGYTEISYELYKKGNMYCNRNRLFRQYKKKHNL